MSFQHRANTFRPTTFDLQARTIEAIASTGAAVKRPGYTEVLDLAGADLSLLIGAPVLDGHQRNTTRDQLGVIEAARVIPEGLWVTIRFRENTAALAVMMAGEVCVSAFGRTTLSFSCQYVSGYVSGPCEQSHVQESRGTDAWVGDA